MLIFPSPFSVAEGSRLKRRRWRRPTTSTAKEERDHRSRSRRSRGGALWDGKRDAAAAPSLRRLKGVRRAEEEEKRGGDRLWTEDTGFFRRGKVPVARPLRRRRPNHCRRCRLCPPHSLSLFSSISRSHSASGKGPSRRYLRPPLGESVFFYPTIYLLRTAWESTEKSPQRACRAWLGRPKES
jgi:hypothetical protein